MQENNRTTGTFVYLGDGALKGAAAYLAGVMRHTGLDFIHVPSNAPFDDSLLNEGPRALILSDYPSANFGGPQLRRVLELVQKGMGLVMIGGWASYVGSDGGYQNTILADALPVLMEDGDDRQNCWNPCVVEKAARHEIVDALPLSSDLPCVGGFNRFTARAEGQTILTVRRFDLACDGNGEIVCLRRASHPLLVLGSHGEGRIACFAGDVAPHWVGGLLDWGDTRITSRAEGANQVEVGNLYVRMFANMIGWAGRRSQADTQL